ncbi:MAG: agmatine deiminase family protein [Rhodothermaceae bacterium]|nr:agmatine deiminase family protein [Rhodothermaceae bacterium]
MPAEWEPHQATWLTWPHCDDTWPGEVEAVVPAYLAMIEALRSGETVYVSTLDEAHCEAVRERLREANIATGPGSTVQLHVLPTDDEWIRDYGPLVVRNHNGLAVTDWLFNAWGEKYDRPGPNNTVSAAIAARLNLPRFDCPIVLEGGSIDVNGQGLALTTSCLLHPNRNPGLSQAEIETWLGEGLGIEEIVWLGDGIVGDDTDGHIDDLTRFVAPDTVVTVVEVDPTDANYAPLRENRERLRRYRTRSASPLRVIELPMPAPVLHKGERLPASYANFYLGNAVLLLPVFADPNDAVAEERLQALFPTRRVVPIDARLLVRGRGACHCLTQQIPASP